MAIENFDKQHFGTRLNEVLFASQPIQSVEHLFGRQQELDRIEKALFAAGRHIFIYGDRGVGKSSLAATAANQYQSVDSEYIDVGCSPDATLRSIVANIAYQAIHASRLRKTKRNTSVGIELRFLKAALASETTQANLHEEIVSLADAVEVLREAANLHSERPIVVLDEFDRISEPRERAAFADLIKQMGDKKVPLKLIFTGVGKSLDELLGAHQSAIRQLEGIELPKLSWTARWDIVLAAADAFGISVDKEIYIRIAAVCDGYPYYAHFITEKMLWCAFDDPTPLTEIKWDHYHAGLRHAIDSISAELKRPYQDAVNKRSGEYEEVLWATADSEYLERFMKQMYSSYEYIMKQRRNSIVLSYEKFCARIRKLRDLSYGAILVNDPSNPGLYTYREKMLRGYVRMQAEAHGIELAGEKIDHTVRQTMRVPSSAGRGYYTSQPPPGIHWERERRNGDDHDDN
ncbi:MULTISPECIES: ATP-binding protein [unclassified Caballeronia]|uniref:ATP-binding protein n=1 Tax=unclassified Caballeronia TaxID=2646786 RepID=UPI002858D9B4|nr:MULTISPECIES: ATP-binding protein [unclassified Caballeronia]MDR5754874.1 ATP-binding protein [Caballeronia sp. LZ024]MDR5845434.1 ATP-binding protein [Caballeronia sp. LZ031]